MAAAGRGRRGGFSSASTALKTQETNKVLFRKCLPIAAKSTQ